MHRLLDSGDGRKLEKFGEYILDRPDPQIIWTKNTPELWKTADAIFEDSWMMKTDMPSEWQVKYQDLNLNLKLTPFKHTGIFPEQKSQWDWMRTLDAKKVLNLFGYTGVATLVCAQAGAEVTYVDASKQALTWARKNQDSSGLSDKPIRWILDDVLKFVEREVKRGNKYDAIVMDPPVFGHGPDGETWQFNKSLPELMRLCAQVLTDQPKFVLINAYAVSTSHLTLNNLLQDLMRQHSGKIESGELVLVPESGSKNLSTGIFAKWCAT